MLTSIKPRKVAEQSTWIFSEIHADFPKILWIFRNPRGFFENPLDFQKGDSVKIHVDDLSNCVNFFRESMGFQQQKSTWILIKIQWISEKYKLSLN